ncbi:hypothetical protein B5E41_29215 [Rhizobium esperanzae]|uniref:Uncharacterized protein n=1 Tax=Rhizobium esperanzae TaxID=1967781 RepID=A0A246DLE8_9HYPH|nr:hypothetical protein [Rhizobium esperanzae]OWO90009.1 hypothetical protein B5E41_29215 [Rhizobium esperanzae]
MWPKSKTKKITVAFHGVRINIDTELPIIKAGVIELLRDHPELALSRTREGVLSIDQLTRDIAARDQQISLLQDADAASSYHASRAEIERTAKLRTIQAEVFAQQAPIVFVGNSEEATAVDFCLAAALAVSRIGDGEISYQVKALLQIALECAESEAQAAKAMLEQQAVRRPPMPKHAASRPVQGGALKLDAMKVSQPELMDEPGPWKARRIPYNKDRLFTSAEYLDHFKAKWSGVALADEKAGSIEVSARLLEFANALRFSKSNVVSLRKSNLDGLKWPVVVRRFLDEMFPPNFEAKSLRVTAILSALLDAEDLHEEGADFRYVANHVVAASELLDQEIAFQQAEQMKANRSPATGPVALPAVSSVAKVDEVERIWTRDPDAE